MAVKAYFISDLHLGSSTEPKAFILLNFLKSFTSQEQISHLFMVGDIFDLWISNHQYFIEKFQPIINELKRLHDLGVEINYFEGNHDLYLQDYFTHKLGFKVYAKAFHFQLGDFNVRVEHGDEMDPQDTAYLFLRWLLRTALMKWLAPRLPTAFVVFLGSQMSHASRKYTSKLKIISKERAQKVIRDHANKVFAKTPFDLIISGHVHVIDDYKLKDYRVVNLGSWFDGCRAFRLVNGNGEFIQL